MAGVFLNGVFSEGFDHTTTTSQIFTANAAGTISSSFARFAAQANAVSQGWQSGNNFSNLGLGVQLPSVIVNAAFQAPSFPLGGNNNIIQLLDSTVGQFGTTQVSLGYNSGGNLVVLRGASVIATSVLTIAPLAYYHVQFKVTINASGLAEVRVNGNATPWISFSGNTQNTANAFTDAVGMGGSQLLMDDWTMQDTTGTAPLNDYLGDKKIITFLPNNDSATGGLNQFSTQPSRSAGSHYLNVNANPPVDTNYNFDSTVNDRESYRFPSIAQASGVISWVNGKARLWKDDAASRSVAIVARNNAVDTVGTTNIMPSTPTYFANPFPNDPNTAAAWTIAGWNGGAEMGVKIIS